MSEAERYEKDLAKARSRTLERNREILIEIDAEIDQMDTGEGQDPTTMMHLARKQRIARAITQAIAEQECTAIGR